MRLPGWKKAQKKQQQKKASLVFKKAIVLVFVLLFFGLGYQLWRTFQGSSWDGQNRLTFSLNAEPMLVISFNPLEKTMVILSLPGETYLEAIGGYGFYKAESLWALGELEDWPGELLAGSLQEYLGAPVEAYASGVDFQWQADQPKKSCLALIKSLFWGQGVTNLTKGDLVRLWLGVNQVRFDRISLVRLEETEAVKEITLADGTQALESSPLYLDRLISQLLVDQGIRAEDLSIGVFNAAGKPGLAKRAARLVNNFGGQVIEVGDWGETMANCQIRSRPELKRSYTVRKLSQIFNCQSSRQPTEGQVEVSLILGENYWQDLMGK